MKIECGCACGCTQKATKRVERGFILYPACDRCAGEKYVHYVETLEAWQRERKGKK